MKTVYSFFLTLVLLLPGLLLPRGARAQEPGPLYSRPEFTNCFPARSQRPGGPGQLVAQPQSGFSNYGSAVTAQGVLKVLVVFAGFTNDVHPLAPNFDTNNNPNNPWPQDDGVHPVGQSFPRNVTADFYTSLASFQDNAVDRTLSNFYYQMSRHSANPFKMQAVFFPKRINVTADNTKNFDPRGFFAYTDEVVAALKNDPDTQNFDFSQVDQRGGPPNFTHDNSTTPRTTASIIPSSSGATPERHITPRYPILSTNKASHIPEPAGPRCRPSPAFLPSTASNTASTG